MPVACFTSSHAHVWESLFTLQLHDI